MEIKMKYLVKLSFYSIILGTLATAMLDIWNWSRHYLFDTPLTKYEFIGRWMLYMFDGQFYHTSIKASPALPYELLAGWLGHYFIGIVFAALLLLVFGLKWLEKPMFKPAIIIGMVTVVIPYLIMQPGMGMGIAGYLTPNPMFVITKVIVSHVAFGVALYLGGILIKSVKTNR